MENEEKIPRLTVFTPTYNRANTLERVYNSLKNQSFKDFTWLIVDDGSKDNTEEIIENFKAENILSIKYVYQENQGKHVAVNNAIKQTNTELFIIADSDDTFVPEAFSKLIKAWDRIPNDEKNMYNGVICRCFDNRTKEPIGKEFPKDFFISDAIEAYFKHKLRFEKWQLFTTVAFKEFPFPNEEKLKFFPETALWQMMAKKYKTVYINETLREYYRDQENSLINEKKHSKENMYLWKHFINNVSGKNFIYNPKIFIKSYLGLSMDGIKSGKKFKEIVKIPKKWYKKAICICAYPFGFLLSKYK